MVGLSKLKPGRGGLQRRVTHAPPAQGSGLRSEQAHRDPRRRASADISSGGGERRQAPTRTLASRRISGSESPPGRAARLPVDHAISLRDPAFQASSRQPRVTRHSHSAEAGTALRAPEAIRAAEPAEPVVPRPAGQLAPRPSAPGRLEGEACLVSRCRTAPGARSSFGPDSSLLPPLDDILRRSTRASLVPQSLGSCGRLRRGLDRSALLSFPFDSGDGAWRPGRLLNAFLA